MSADVITLNRFENRLRNSSSPTGSPVGSPTGSSGSPKEVFGRRPFLRKGKSLQHAAAMKKDIALAETSTVSPFRGSEVYRSADLGSLYLSTCPGKKIASGRNGKSYLRSLNNDIQQAKDKFGITAILCLLNPSELRTLGVHPEMYEQVCAKKDIKLIMYPIIEMAAPGDTATFSRDIVDHRVIKEIQSGGSVLVHCRGGVGRAGMVAACLILRLGVANSVDAAVSRVRHFRDPRSVESQIQLNFVKKYAAHIANMEDTFDLPCSLPSTPTEPSECQPGVLFSAMRRTKA